MLETHYLKKEHGYILIREWAPVESPLGVFHIFHGMMEHSGMYHEWAIKLTQLNWVVIAHDHPGSGLSIDRQMARDTATKSSHNQLINDALNVHDWIQHKYPLLNIVRYGHSMGAFLALTMPDEPRAQGIILTGLKYEPQLKLRIQKMILSLGCMLFGDLSPAHLAHQITFNGGHVYRDQKDNPNDFNWVSRNPIVLNKYISDLHCGNIVSWGYFYMVNQLLINMHGPLSINNTNRILIMSGENDPLSFGGKQLGPLINKLEHLSIEMHHEIIPGAHHKIEGDDNENIAINLIKAFITKQ
ncbi:MAG: alpha/beta hydrolase [Candidatus Margulisiibacteriota bacterium]